MLQLKNKHGFVGVYCVSEREMVLPYLVFFDKVLNRFTQIDHQRFQDAFSSDGDVHSLIKNSYN